MAVPAPDVMIRPNPRAVYRDLADGAGGVVLHLDTAAYHGVNAFGAHVWSSLGDGGTVSDLIAGIRGSVEGVPDGVEDEVGGFLSELHERGLVLYGDQPDG